MMNEQKIIAAMLAVITVLCFLKLWSVLTLKALGIELPAELLSVFEVIASNLWLAPLVTLIYILLPIVAAVLFFLGREYRVVSHYIVANWAGSLVAAMIALQLFSAWQSIPVSYYPWEAISLFYELDAGTLLYQRLFICLIACMIPVIGLNFLGHIGRNKKMEKLLGNAHFASAMEIKKAGLFKPQGLVLGIYHGQPLRQDDFGSVLVNAPSGSGKSAGIAIPNLIEFREGSIIGTDLKSELYEKTAQYREKILGNEVYQLKFILNEKDTALLAEGLGHYAQSDPFFYVRKEEAYFNQDVLFIADAWYPDPMGSEGAFWAETSRKLFLAIARFLWETTDDVTLGKIFDVGHKPNMYNAIFDEISNFTHRDKTLSSELKNTFAMFLSYDDETRKNILTSFQSKMEFLLIPSVRERTSGNSFDLRDLRKKKMTIYLTMTGTDLKLLKPLLRIFWAQLTYFMTQEEPCLRQEPYPVLCLMDEFGLQPRIDIIKQDISFFRSFRLRFIIVVQFYDQLVEAYGVHGAKAFDNMQTRLIFTPTAYDDAEKLSKALGVRAVKVDAKSMNAGTMQSTGHTTNSYSYQSQPLMRADEILRMHEDTLIILMKGQPPIKIKKAYWFKHKQYREALEAAQQK